MAKVLPYLPQFKDAVIDLSMRAWEPVFKEMRAAVPAFVYSSFYPEGWEARQRSDISRILETESDHTYVAVENDAVVGWMSLKFYPEDSMGELHIIAVDPEHQSRGIGTQLMTAADVIIRDAGMGMVMVETGSDPGHLAARAAYESHGYLRWPVARYFKNLRDT